MNENLFSEAYYTTISERVKLMSLISDFRIGSFLRYENKIYQVFDKGLNSKRHWNNRSYFFILELVTDRSAPLLNVNVNPYNDIPFKKLEQFEHLILNAYLVAHSKQSSPKGHYEMGFPSAEGIREDLKTLVR